MTVSKIKSLAALICLYVTAVQAQQAVNYEQATDRDVKYELKIYTSDCEQCGTPQMVSFTLYGSDSGASPISLNVTGFSRNSFKLVPAMGKNIGYPCSLRVDAHNDDGWGANRVEISYYYKTTVVGTWMFRGFRDGKVSSVGWVDTKDCPDKSAADVCLQRVVYADPEPPACGLAAGMQSAAASANVQATVQQPTHHPNGSRTSFSVASNVSGGQGRTATLELLFFLRSDGETPISPNPYFKDVNGNAARTSQSLPIGSNSQILTFNDLQIPNGAFEELARRQEPYRLRVIATLSVDGNEIEKSIPLDFDYFFY